MAGYQLRVTIPTELKERVHQYMAEDKRSESNAVEVLLEAGLEAKFPDKNATKGKANAHA